MKTVKNKGHDRALKSVTSSLPAGQAALTLSQQIPHKFRQAHKEQPGTATPVLLVKDNTSICDL